MAVRVGQTRTAAPRLLKTVRGQPHATREDHEEAPQADVNAEPASSDDEALRAPPKQSKSTQDLEYNDEHPLRKPPGSNRKRKAEHPLLEQESQPEPVLRKPGANKTRGTAPRVPRVGHFQQNRAAKEGLDVEKENTAATHAPPYSSQGNEWGFSPLLVESSQGSQKGRKTHYGSKARNSQTSSHVHAATPATQKRSKPAKYGAKFNMQNVPLENDDDDLDNVSMLPEPLNEDQLEELGALVDMPEKRPEDPELRKVPQRKKIVAQINDDAPGPSAMDDTELANVLEPTLREQLGLTDALYSSLPASSAPQEDMDNIDSYVRRLPAEVDEDAACPICHESVAQDYYWRFWKGRDRTVKNQATFCHTHRKASAQSEYAADGYPTIDWSKLSERIKKHRMALYNILTGETSNPYRTRYEPLALTGKAAAVPSKRSDLSPSKQRRLASHALDDKAVYPGYYGPRGRRLITESVMSLLDTEIKRSADPVVQTSGPATFVQAVLVPEIAVRLIMEDMKCDGDEAEDIRERTFDMGVLLNEEIEDEVHVDEEEDEGDNEYIHH